jgi:hypothetical protein
MTKFTENLWSDLAREHGATLANAARPEPGRARRPRVLAGSTLALAGAGTALGLVLSAAGSTPAWAVTRSSDGSILVQINQANALPAAESKLAAMGVHEEVIIYMGSGKAAVSGPVTCTPAPGLSGPAVKVLVGTNGTEVIAPGTTGGNTGVGTWHLNSCTLVADTGSGNAGNSGPGNTNNTGGSLKFSNLKTGTYKVATATAE